VFEADVNGADLVLIITSKKTPSLVYLVTSRKIRNLDQLKSATFGVSRIGSTPDMILRWTLRQIGINPEKDVKILQIGNSPLRMAALEAGRIDGTILTVDDKVAADKLNLNVLLDLRKLGIEWLEADVVTSRQVISKSEDTVRKFVRSMITGIHYFKTHKAESMKVMARYMTNADPKVIEAGYDFHAKEYQEKPYPSIKAMQVALEEIARRNPSVKGARLEQFYEPKFVRELDESGFIDGLYH
jgi:NitT/TauT family transport system substrate-binding protein